MNVIFVISLVVLASFSLCQAATPSMDVKGANFNTRKVYNPGQAINKMFSSPIASSNGYLLGGMHFLNGEITVPEPGVYFVYATLRVHGYEQRFALRINSADVFYAVPTGSGQVSMMGTYCLEKGDKISLKAFDKVDVWVSKTHDNFGAFKIVGTGTC